MVLKDVGQVIGTRDLDLDGKRAATVIVGAPQKHPEGDYFCAYQITGIGDERIRYAMGIDGLQALQLALKKIGTDLYTSPEARGGRLLWFGQTVQGDLGFPVLDAQKDLVP
jgi:hypothetical protein